VSASLAVLAGVPRKTIDPGPFRFLAIHGRTARAMSNTK
jgi:hypothetical protein